jgi:ABC-type transport system involved in multi-copper enzyme maturation permease subunit
MSAVLVIAGYGLREALRRRVFAVVLVLTAAFLFLFWLGTRYLFDHLANVGPTPAGIDARTLVGATVLGLAMFGTLFLGVVLAVFLTLGVVRGDAERGLLQPLVVRPVGRTSVLVARFLGTAAVCTPYVLLVYAASVVITQANGSWTPDRVVIPGLELAGGVLVIGAISLLGSVFLTPTANGIAVFMVFGAGLIAGLLGQIGSALHSPKLEHIATITAWAAPFEALYQDALHGITANTTGFTRVALSLGPFGGAHVGGPFLGVWAVLFVVIVGAIGSLGFTRSDL